MKNKLTVLVAVVIAVAVFSGLACGQTEITEKKLPVPHCERPMGKVALGKVTCKAASCRQPNSPAMALIQQLVSISGVPAYEGIGDGVADMLLSALKQTNCFDILERENFDEINRELALYGKEMKIEPADYMISGAITSLTMESSNTNLGLGVLPVLSSIDIKKTKAIVGMDIRVVDVNSAKVTFTKTYEANNSKSGLGFGGGAGWSGVGFGGAYSSLRGSALEEVVRDVVVRATIDIIGAGNSLKAQARAETSGATVAEGAPESRSHGLTASAETGSQPADGDIK